MDGELLTLMEWMELHEKELSPEQRFQYEMLCGNRRTDTLLLTMNNLLAADAQLQMMNSTTLSNIARALKAVGKQLYVSIPDSGGLYLLQAGTTTIDFVDGKMIIPNGDVQTLRTSLRVQNVEEMRSLVLTTSGQLSFSIDGGGFFTLDAGEKFATSDYGFKTIYLDVPAPAFIKMMASTTPELTVMYDRFMSEDLMDMFGPITIDEYDLDLTVAHSVTLDNSTASRLHVEAFGKSDVPADFLLETSDDNSHWVEVDSVTGVSDYHFGGDNAFRYVRLSSSAAGVAGDLVSLVIKGMR